MGLLDTFRRSRTDKQISGQAGEDDALVYLQRQGLTLVERNFRCKGGELDLIMQGKMDDVIEAVTSYYQTQKLNQDAAKNDGVPNHKSRVTAGEQAP